MAEPTGHGAPAGSGDGVRTQRALHLLTGGGWRAAVTLACLGAAGAAALPPVHMVVALVPAFAGLLIAIHAGRTVRRAAMAGWWFGVGHFGAGFYWVAHAFFVEADKYGFLAPFAVIGLAAGMALFPALASGALALLLRWRNSRPVGRVLAFAAVWTVAEWLRSWVFTGLPWNLVGSVWTETGPILQTTSYLGVFGLGLVTTAAAASAAVFAWEADRWRAARPVLVAGAMLAALYADGQIRMSGSSPQTSAEAPRLRLVQPNVPQHLKWKSGLKAGHVRTLLDLSAQVPAAGKTPRVVIWPETSVPFNLFGDRPLQAALASAVPAGGYLIAGAPKAETLDGAARRLTNSLHALNASGKIVATYDKRHLVPFGEYVPFRAILPIEKLTAGRLDFSPGTGPRLLTLPGLPPALALICYEVIFPAEVGGTTSRPGWLLNITNDAWFGRSAGPYQHLAAAQLRAAEQGLPLVRVANTGVSAVIDASGRIVASLALGEQGVLDVDLPPARRPTVYSRFGDSFAWALIAVFLLVAASVTRKREIEES